MSLFLQAEVRFDSFTARGYVPARIPAHQVLLLTGMICSTCGNRKKEGSSPITVSLRRELLCVHRSDFGPIVPAGWAQNSFRLQTRTLTATPQISIGVSLYCYPYFLSTTAIRKTVSELASCTDCDPRLPTMMPFAPLWTFPDSPVAA